MPNYVRASYWRWFIEGKEVGAEPNLSESLSEIGQDPDRVIVAPTPKPSDAPMMTTPSRRDG